MIFVDDEDYQYGYEYGVEDGLYDKGFVDDDGLRRNWEWMIEGTIAKVEFV